MSDGKIQRIQLGQLIPHPDNPRRDDDEKRLERIERYAEDMKRAGFIADQYAFVVRPLGNEYQVIQGHTRREAALIAGVADAPCIVQDFTDDEAFFELVRGNDQGELEKLEIGKHVLKYVDVGDVGAGRGNSGGIREYSRRTGIPHPHLLRFRQAAEVAGVAEENGTNCTILPISTLCEIHQAPRAYWNNIVEQVAAHGWTAARVRDEVQSIQRAENAKLEAAEREAKEEADAKAFIEAKAPDFAEQVGSGPEFKYETYAEAKAVWELRNREEAARIAKEKEAAELREREERRGRTQKYSNILSSIHNLATWGDFNDTPWVMEDFNPAELSPTDLYKVIDEAESAARFIKEFIEWRDAR